jgi:general secretion pathway protein A
MQAMIKYRLSVARNFEIAPSLFSLGGHAAVYLATGGYPRKIVSLCHQVILKLIIRNKKKAGWFLVRSCVSGMEAPLFRRTKWALVSFLIVIALGFSIRAIILQIQNNNAYKQLPTTQIVPEVKQLTPTHIAPDLVMKTTALPDSSIIQEEKNKDNKMPDDIGMLTMKKGMTLSWTLYNIYGVASSGIIGAVIKVNPHIKNKDIIMEGDIITLPEIPADVQPVKNDDFIILLKQGKDIEIMYSFFWENQYRQNMPPIVFFPFWNKKEEGVTFAVVIDKCFGNDHEAQKAISELPPAIAANTKILSPGDANTVFFNRRALQR